MKAIVPFSRRTCQDHISRSLTVHHPAPLDSTLNSDLHPETIRKLESTLTLQNHDDSTKKKPSRCEDQTLERIEDWKSGERKDLAVKSPSSLVLHPTEWNYPMVDISDYKSYRHRLIETGLRRQYDNFQPPGNVVLNSIHLNSPDSIIGGEFNQLYDPDLFDFIEKSYNANAMTMNRQNREQPGPLDYFLLRNMEKSKTVERETATLDNDKDLITWNISKTVVQDQVPENVTDNYSGIDNNGNPCDYVIQEDISVEDNISIGDNDRNSKLGIFKRELIPTQSHKNVNKTTLKHNIENDSGYTKSSWMTRSRPASAGGISTTSRTPALSQPVALSERRRVTKSPRSKISTDTIQRYEKKLVDYPDEFSSRSKRATMRARRNDISASFSEIGSSCSDSSKQRDEMSYRSRESSISSSKSHKRPPWLSGNHRTSFNRKYGNITKNCGRNKRSTSTHKNNMTEKLTVSSGERSRESTTVSTNSGVVSFLKQKAKSLIVTSQPKARITSIDREIERHTTVISSREQDEIKDTESVVVARDNNNKTGRISRIHGKIISSSKIPISGISDSVTSFLSSGQAPMRVKPTRLPHSSSADVPAATASTALSQTSTTKEPRLTTRSTDGVRKKLPVENARYSKLPLTREQRENSSRLNDSGGQRLRNRENSAFSKHIPLSGKIKLSTQVLNNIDDNKLVEHTSGRNSSKNVKVSENNETEMIVNVEENVKVMRTTNDIRTNHDNSVTQSKLPRIIPNLRTKPASADNLSSSYKSALTSSRTLATQRNANPVRKGGLNSTKLNTRSNDVIDKMKCDKFSRESSSTLRENNGNVDETRACTKTKKDITMDNIEQELKLLQYESTTGLAVNSVLKRYAEKLREGLLKRDNGDNVALASLSLTDAVSILSEQNANLSSVEIQELQDVLRKIERNPELLYQ